MFWLACANIAVGHGAVKINIMYSLELGICTYHNNAQSCCFRFPYQG